MEHQKRSQDEQQLEEHSLPGINMAGKGAAECEGDDREGGATREHAPSENENPVEPKKNR